MSLSLSFTSTIKDIFSMSAITATMRNQNMIKIMSKILDEVCFSLKTVIEEHCTYLILS